MIKIGDVVVGTKEANEYGVTVEGCVLKVTAVEDGLFNGQIVKQLKYARGNIGGSFYGLKLSRFVLLKAKKKRNLPDWW